MGAAFERDKVACQATRSCSPRVVPHDLYVIRSGEFVASSAAHGDLTTMTAGDWFGEIGLLRSGAAHGHGHCAYRR